LKNRKKTQRIYTCYRRWKTTPCCKHCKKKDTNCL